ncbi:MAG: hypothetical protein NTZ65_04030 [Candidatus Berkelbacteria bacterium]|nr:hypothetical protein [Candidatus Berkelbacteria bacterium]
MGDTTLGEALRQIAGPLKDLHEKLSGEEGLVWLEKLKKFLRKENPWAEVQKVVVALLKFVKTVELPAVGAFKPEDHFKVTPERERKTAKVVIGYVSDNVKALIKGRLEPEEAQATIRIHELCQASVDDPILAELGENVKTGLNRMFQIIEEQGRGQEGDLLVDGRANIFYIEGTDWAVLCDWRAGPRLEPLRQSGLFSAQLERCLPGLLPLILWYFGALCPLYPSPPCPCDPLKSRLWRESRRVTFLLK